MDNSSEQHSQMPLNLRCILNSVTESRVKNNEKSNPTIGGISFSNMSPVSDASKHTAGKSSDTFSKLVPNLFLFHFGIL